MTTVLTNRNNDTNSQISALNDQLAQMQQMIADMQTQMRQLNQQHKAQETLTKEWESTTKTVTKAFKDACSVYGSPEAIDDMIIDLQSIADEVKQDFDTYAESDRYLNQVTAEIEDEEFEVIEPVAVLESVMPDENDNETNLTPRQIETIIEVVNEDVLSQLRTLFEISGRVHKLSSVS